MPDWHQDDDEDGVMERVVPVTPIDIEKHRRYGGYGDTGRADMSDKKGKGWFIPIMPMDPKNFRGRIWGAGRLGIHPDGSKELPHTFDGTEGCIGIQEGDTSDLAKLFKKLTEGTLATSDELYVEMRKEQALFIKENLVAYGNKPNCVSVLVKL